MLKVLPRFLSKKGPKVSKTKKEPDFEEGDQIGRNIKTNFSGKKLGEDNELDLTANHLSDSISIKKLKNLELENECINKYCNELVKNHNDLEKHMNDLRKRHDVEKQRMEKRYKELEECYNLEKNMMKKRYSSLEERYNNLEKRYDNLGETYNNLKKNYCDEEEQRIEKERYYFENQNAEEMKECYYLENQNAEEMKKMKKDYEELKLEKKYTEENINSLEKQLFKQKFQQAQVTYKNNVENIRQKLNEKGNVLRELEEMNAKYRELASKYQTATNGDDPDHLIKLNRDILKLQIALENYVTHLKPNMDLDIEQIQILAQGYGCLNEITVENPNKPFIKAILQREVLELVHRFSRGLSNSKGNDFVLESDIDIAAIELLKLIEKFLTTRAGTDEVANAATIKIRQQVYGILGNHGFNDMTQSDGSRIHTYISYVSDELNKIMNQYRKINDPKKEKQINAMAPKLVQDIFKLFWFRVNAQEPIVELEFFKNDKIDPNTMEGVWNEDEIDQLCVDICYFPLIGQNLNFSERKIYTFAKVFPRNTNEDKEETT